ncbi:MAG: hypothetical protein LBI94_08100, partial [Treponema sp.]|nr:hypothetical protein [Treponema sp.]
GAVNFTAKSASYYVKDTGSDTVGAGTLSAPFKTLAHAYTAALANPAIQTITVLSNLDLDAGAAMELNAHGGAPQEITITSDGEGGPWTLARSFGNGKVVEDAVVTVTGGAQVVFSNITIDGKNNRSLGSTLNRALYIEGAKVTLGAGAHLVGKYEFLTNYGNIESGGGAVYVKSGELIMNDGSTITGEAGNPDMDTSDDRAFSGGGVYVDSAGTFTMNGGTVSGYALSGGGIFSSGIFTMNNGEISGCTTNPFGWFPFTNPSGGAGVYVAGGTFTMNNGTIKDNIRYNNSLTGGGGGVFVAGGEFLMKGGTMSGNEAEGSSGGGVYVDSAGKFTMSGNSVISGNSAMSGSPVYGSGILGGEGGGVYNRGEFEMTSGTIYGYDSTEVVESMRNKAGLGSSTYVDSSAGAGSDDTINSYP